MLRGLPSSSDGPVALTIGKDGVVTKEMATQNLATELAKRAAAGQKQAGLAAKK